MKQLFTFLLLAISAVVFSQAPQSIPYQAVVRNTDGSNMANAAATITFKIHDNSATGTVVYEETHYHHHQRTRIGEFECRRRNSRDRYIQWNPVGNRKQVLACADECGGIVTGKQIGRAHV